MIVKLLTEHHFEFLILKGGCRSSSQSTHAKLPYCGNLMHWLIIIKGSDKGVASDKRCNIYSPTIDTSIQCVLYKKKNTVHYIDYIGAELVRGRVC